jgi:hypothetical protein
LAEQDDRTWLLEQLRGRDVPCPKCGYNLRGSAAEQCPECGQAFDRRVLNQPQKLKLSPWFWIGLVVDYTAAIVIVGHVMTRPEWWESWGLILLSTLFTACFVLFTFSRQYRHSPDEFAAELAWAVWIPLFLKLTCLTGMLIAGK